MRLILVRHPQPLVGPGICYGSSDLPVDAAVLAQSAQGLVSHLPRCTPIFSSPLQRCAGLARTLQASLASPLLEFDARLAELEFGRWEMQAWDAIARREIDAWAADVVRYRPGGAESVLEMAQRIAAFYADLERRRPECALLICHAGSMRLLAARHAGMTPEQMAMHAARATQHIAYGSTVILDD